MVDTIEEIDVPVERELDGEGLALQFRSKTIRDAPLKQVTAHDGAELDKTDIGDGMFGRVDQTVFRSEERAVEPANGVVPALEQIESLVLGEEMADAPFGGALALAGATT